MHRLSYLFFRTIILSVFMVSVCMASTTLYVTSESADLKSESTSSSSTIAELERGTVLLLIAKEGRWFRVATQESQRGWIYRGKVSEEQPEVESIDEGEDSIGSLLGGLSGSDIRADAADSSRSIRGLSPEAEEYAKAAGTPRQSRNALDATLSRKVKDSDIEAFLKNGKVGEYAD